MHHLKTLQHKLHSCCCVLVLLQRAVKHDSPPTRMSSNWMCLTHNWSRPGFTFNLAHIPETTTLHCSLTSALNNQPVEPRCLPCVNNNASVSKGNTLQLHSSISCQETHKTYSKHYIETLLNTSEHTFVRPPCCCLVALNVGVNKSCSTASRPEALDMLQHHCDSAEEEWRRHQSPAQTTWILLTGSSSFTKPAAL